MCVSTVGRVVSIDQERGTAVVAAGDRDRQVSLAAIVLAGDAVAVGDWVLVATGLALAVLDDDDAGALLESHPSPRRNPADA